MTELWQLYDENGNALAGQGVTKDEVYAGALHGAAHVWIWRSNKGGIELLLQKRASGKRTWPGTWDVSAAGHIDVNESPLAAAIRETKEEIGLNLRQKDVVFVAKRRDNLVAPSGDIENEFRWIYAVRLEDRSSLRLEKEVDEIAWKRLERIKAELADEIQLRNYVPQGSSYFKEVFGAIEKLAGQ